MPCNVYDCLCVKNTVERKAWEAMKNQEAENEKKELKQQIEQLQDKLNQTKVRNY